MRDRKYCSFNSEHHWGCVLPFASNSYNLGVSNLAFYLGWGTFRDKECCWFYSKLVGKISCDSCQYSLIHPSQKNDNLHSSTPFYMHDSDGNFTKLSIENQPDARSFRMKSGKFAMAESYEGDQKRILVVDLNHGNITLDTIGTNALWIVELLKSKDKP